MGLLALLSLLSCIVTFVFANRVYFEDKKSSINKVFALAFGLQSAMIFTEFMIRQTDNAGTALGWFKIRSFSPFTLPLLFHFAGLFTKSKWLQHRTTYLAIYLPPIPLAFIYLMSLKGVVPIKSVWEYTLVGIPEMYAYNLLSSVWYAMLAIASVAMVFVYSIRTKEAKAKTQAKYITIAMLIPVLAGVLTQGLPQAFEIQSPDFTNIAIALMAVIIAYAMRQHELFVVDPTTAADNIISTINDPLFLVACEGAITSVNNAAAHSLGYDKSELLNAPIDALFENEKIIESGGGGKGVKYLRAKNGRQIPVSISISALKDKKDTVGGYVIIARDMTEQQDSENKLRQLLEALRHSNSELEQFAYVASHDLQEPLRMVSSYLQLLEKRNLDKLDTDSKEFIGFAVDGAKRMRQLINDLLAYSRVSTKGRP
ncbi:MAG: histidine kinase N-terminal 7TM domain-containing protein, partial [Fibrobacterota bacterium]